MSMSRSMGSAGVAVERIGDAAPALPERDDARLRALVLEHVDFVWRALRRLGLPEVDLGEAAPRTRSLSRARRTVARTAAGGTNMNERPKCSVSADELERSLIASARIDDASAPDAVKNRILTAVGVAGALGASGTVAATAS